MTRLFHFALIGVPAILACIVASPVCRADEQNEPKDAKTGSFQVTIPRRSRESAIPSIISRLGWGSVDVVKNSKDEQDYDLAKETFEVYVPADYTGKESYGLFVWVNPGPDGKVHGRWTEVLDKHKLIWIGANNSGNNRAGWIRLGLALDAAAYMPTKYNTDKDRVYVSGASGGGKCSSMLGIVWPDVFTGGSYPMLGLNFYRRVMVSAGGVGKQSEFYPQSFKRPPAKLWDLVTKERRHVFLTGDNDMNRQPTELMFKEAKKDGFKYITYIQVPGMGHQPPDAEWFEKGIIALDERRETVADARAGAGVQAAAKAVTKQPKPAAQSSKAAPVEEPTDAALSPDEQAEKLMKLARLYAENRLYGKAREKLKQLVKDFPKSKFVPEAERMLKEIGRG